MFSILKVSTVTSYARTTTVAVCNAAQFGNGITYGSGDIYNGLPSGYTQSFSQVFPGVTDPMQCCALRFEAEGCLNYFIYFAGLLSARYLRCASRNYSNSGCISAMSNGTYQCRL